MSEPVKKVRIKRKILVESFIVFFIALTPFLFKIYDYFPGPNSSVETVSFLGITIGKNGFNSIETNVWYYTGKIVPLTLLLIWFFTSKDWWYHILIIPIATYAFQLFEIVFFSDETIDTQNILWVLPICMVVIPFVYFIRIKLYDKHVHGIDLEAMDAELKFYQEKERLKKEKELERKKL